MAYCKFLVERIQQRLASETSVELKKMMGGLIIMVNNKMCLGVDIDRETGEDRLMVRVGKVPYDALLLKKGSSEMGFTGKVFRGFLFIDPSGFDLDEDLDFWIAKAMEFNKVIEKK